MPSFVAKQRESPSDLTFDLEGGNLAYVEKARCGVRTEHFFELRRGAYQLRDQTSRHRAVRCF